MGWCTLGASNVANVSSFVKALPAVGRSFYGFIGETSSIARIAVDKNNRESTGGLRCVHEIDIAHLLTGAHDPTIEEATCEARLETIQSVLEGGDLVG